MNVEEEVLAKVKLLKAIEHKVAEFNVGCILLAPDTTSDLRKSLFTRLEAALLAVPVLPPKQPAYVLSIAHYAENADGFVQFDCRFNEADDAAAKVFACTHLRSMIITAECMGATLRNECDDELLTWLDMPVNKKPG